MAPGAAMFRRGWERHASLGVVRFSHLRAPSANATFGLGFVALRVDLTGACKVRGRGRGRALAPLRWRVSAEQNETRRAAWLGRSLFNCLR